MVGGRGATLCWQLQEKPVEAVDKRNRFKINFPFHKEKE